MLTKRASAGLSGTDLALLGASAYSYFLYPALLAAMRAARGAPALRSRPRRGYLSPGTPGPRVSLIITAYNEEDKMEAKLENSSALRYPEGSLEILVASDASTDATDEIVRRHPRAALCRSPERKGKEHAQKLAVGQSTGDILVFTDAATLLEPEALELLVRDFADPRVGAVSSRDALDGREGSGEGLYVRYEMALRRLESDVHGLVGLSGSFFAARREVCRAWSEELPSDFNTVFNCARNGYRAVLDESLVGRYRDIRKGGSEFDRKVRTLLRGITAMAGNLDLLNPLRYRLFAFELFSHKVMRWSAPFFLMALLGRSLAGALAGRPWARLLLAAQAAFYGLAALGALRPRARDRLPIKAAYFFVQVNAAILAAWWKFARGERIKVWNPTRR